MDFLYDFDHFVRNHPGKKISVFFHTSFILEPNENIRRFFQEQKANVYSYIPENCVYELKLLSQHSNVFRFKNNAKELLTRCSINNAWSYHDMCQYKNSFLSFYHCEVALFVFYEPAVAASFSKLMGYCDSVFILSYDIHNMSRYVINTPQQTGHPFRRLCEPANNRYVGIAEVKTQMFEVRDRQDVRRQYISGDKLNFFDGGGESAGIYKTDIMPGKLLKIFNYQPGEGMLKKLKALVDFGEGASIKDCVFPTGLLYCHNVCVGYVMNQLVGLNLGCKLSSYNASERRDLIRRLLLSLLELRIRQLYVADISLGNFFIDNNNNIRILDCESMEVGSWPGGGVTDPYGHPDVTKDYFYKRLRDPDHINFALAVLLFEILLDWENPLTQKGLGDSEPKWRKNKFPYANLNGVGVQAAGVVANKQKLEEWRRQPQAIREAFVEVFNFRRTYDIGEWIKAIGFLS